MIRRITIEQFMSHVRTVIEPAPGLTVIVGPNNCGKSAIVNALQCLAYNAPGKSFVRHNSRYARVTVETEEGDRIEWAREKDQVSYCINGVRTYRSVIPDELPAMLRINEVKGDDGKSEFDIHFAEQKYPIFLLGQEKQAALFFASSSDTGYLLKMQQLWKSRIQEQKRELKRLSDQLTRDRAVLAAYAPVEGIEADVREVTKVYAELEQMEGAREQLNRWMSRVRQVQRTVERQGADCEAIGDLDSPPSLQDTESVGRLVRHWRRLAMDAAREGARLEALQLPAEPLIKDTSELAELVRRIAAKDRNIRKVAQKAEVAATLTAPPMLDDVGELSRWLQVARSLQSRIEETERQVEQLAQQAESVKRDLSEFLRMHPECPTCGAPIDLARFLSNEEHAHV